MGKSENMLLISRKPTHPGEVLRDEFMADYDMSVAQLASRLHTSRQSINELIRERRSVSPEMALKLSKLFGTTPHYWLNLQRNVDLWNSLELNAEDLAKIEPIPVCAAG